MEISGQWLGGYQEGGVRRELVRGDGFGVKLKSLIQFTLMSLRT